MKQLAALRRTSYNRRLRHDTDELISFNVFNNDINQDKSTAELDGQFVHSQLLIDCLQRMKSSSKEVEEFVRFCRDHAEGKDNACYLKLLEEFQNDYSSEQSLWWYTRDSFVYRMLNKALRVQNIDILFLFRFFIRDLEQQLRTHQWSSSGSAYRGQSLSTRELEILKQSVGKLISMNSFLSTTLYRDVATIYVGDMPGLEKVLFKINYNPMIDGFKPFADITLVSEFPQEGEILFMLGAIFQIDSVYYDDDEIWIVELNLCSEHDPVLKSIFHYLRGESNRCELDLLAFGNVLHDMGEFEQAKNYYKRCSTLLSPDDHAWKPYCDYLLGLIATANGDEKNALDLFDKSLSIRTRTLQFSDPSLADTLTAIARVYYINCNFEQALELHKQALTIFQRTFGDDDLTSAMSYTNMGVVLRAQQKYSEALDCHSKALTIRQRHLPLDHFRFGTSYNNIGEVYQGLNEYDMALKYYELALEVYKKSLPLRHIDVAILLVNQGLIYEAKTDLNDALPFYNKALGICRYIWPKVNLQLVQIESMIGETESNTGKVPLLGPLGTIWIRLFRPFKCIASLDPRTSHRKTSESAIRVR